MSHFLASNLNPNLPYASLLFPFYPSQLMATTAFQGSGKDCGSHHGLLLSFPAHVQSISKSFELIKRKTLDKINLTEFSRSKVIC
jgi:hypothetical protein